MFPLNLTSLLCSAAIAAVIGAAGSGILVHKFDAAKYARLELAQANATTKAVQQAAAEQQRVDQANTVAAIAEAKAQARIVTRTRTIKEKVPTYVTPKQDTANCVTFGFIRVLVAAARGISADSLALPAGESNDSCTTLTSSELAATLTEAYGTGNQNAEQLDALIASVKANDAVDEHGIDRSGMP